MLQQKNNLLSRSFLLLLIFFSTFLNASYYPIYKKSNPQFEYAVQNGNYILTLTGQRNINYHLYDGFKFYIPNMTKEFSLQVLRFNSVGYIDGYLSMTPAKRNVVSANPNNLKYYFTDYKTNFRQLEYLLNNKTMLYPRVTSIAIEAYNIPKKKKLNRYFYFTIKRDKNNKLNYLVYSFKLILDKQSVDSFVRKNLKIRHYKNQRFDYIYTYTQSFGKLTTKKRYVKPKKQTVKKPKPVKKKITKKRVTHKKRPAYKLDLARLLYMKEYPYTPQTPKKDYKKLDTKTLTNNINILKTDINYIKNLLNAKLNTTISVRPYKLLKSLNESFNAIDDSLSSISKDINGDLLNQNKTDCIFSSLKEIDKRCFTNSTYFNNYIYFAIKEDKLPLEELLLGFGDYKTFNNLGKYYFEIGEYSKAQKYLLKSYALSKNKNIPSHNLGVYYAKRNSKENNKKSVKYFKQTNFKEDHFNLGVNYYIGLGTKENNKQAYLEFVKAAKLNLEKAKHNVKIMEKYKIGLK